MLKHIIFISICLLISQALYAGNSKVFNTPDKKSEHCLELEHLLSTEQLTAVMEYVQTMVEEATKLDNLVSHFNPISEHTFQTCLRSIKDTMRDPQSTIDTALKVAACFNVDELSTPDESVEVEAHTVDTIKGQLSTILALIKQRIEVAYGASSFEQREAIVACTSYSRVW